MYIVALDNVLGTTDFRVICWLEQQIFLPLKQIILKKLKLPPNFVDFKQTIIPAGDCSNKEWFFAISIEEISQRKTRYFLERAISATSDEQILQRATSDFLQLGISATSKSDFLQRATSVTSKEKICKEQRVILQRVTSNEWILTSNEQRVKSYTSVG